MLGHIPQRVLGIAAIFALLLAVSQAVLVAWLPEVSASPLPAPQRATIIVSIVDNAFQPPSITIQVGDTVTWRNNGSFTHTTTSDTGGLWDSGFLNPGQSFSQTFSTAGTFPYHCTLNAAQGMVATVKVLTAADLTATATITATATGTVTPTPSPTGTVQAATPTPSPTGTAATATPAPAAPVGRPIILVSIVDNRFMPQNLSVGVGSTIIWTNNGSAPHTLTSDADLWESVTLSPSQTFSRTFDAPGQYFYHCEFHRGPGMIGVITVTGVALATPTVALSPTTATPTPASATAAPTTSPTTGPSPGTPTPTTPQPTPVPSLLPPGGSSFPRTLPATGDQGSVPFLLLIAGCLLLAGLAARRTGRR